MDPHPIDWLTSLEKLGMKFGLETIRAILSEMGDPQQCYATVLVAGTNGKGSVTAMTAAGLQAAGYRTGRYTSPHLVRLEERFAIDGEDVDSEVLAAAVDRVRRGVERLTDVGRLSTLPTFFEVTTAAAFDLFREAGVRIAVLEVGLGGRLDSTNVVQPLATAITTIALDHQAQLGNTIPEIAWEKAGIIKPGVPLVLGRVPAEARIVIEDVARSADAPIVEAASAGGLGDLKPSLAGEHQIDNARVALALLATLHERGFPTADAARGKAIEEVQWPGRLELRRYGTSEVLVDAAHNPAGAQALASYLRRTGWTGAALVFGAMSDKDFRRMLLEIGPVVDTIICTTAPSARAADAETLALAAKEVAQAPHVEAVADPVAALERAAALSPRVVVAGSIFLIGPLRDILR